MASGLDNAVALPGQAAKAVLDNATPVASTFERVDDLLPEQVHRGVSPEQIGDVVEARDTIASIRKKRQSGMPMRLLGAAIPGAMAGGFGLGTKMGIGLAGRDYMGRAIGTGALVGGAVGAGAATLNELVDRASEQRRLGKATRILKRAPPSVLGHLDDKPVKEQAESFQAAREYPLRFAELGVLGGGLVGGAYGMRHPYPIPNDGPTDFFGVKGPTQGQWKGFARSGLIGSAVAGGAGALLGYLIRRQRRNQLVNTLAKTSAEQPDDTWLKTNAPKLRIQTGGNPRRASNAALLRGFATTPERYAGGRIVQQAVKFALASLTAATDTSREPARKTASIPKLRSRSETVVYNDTGILGIEKGDYLSMPGGGIDDGETEEVAAHREAIEEADRKLLHLEPFGKPTNAAWPKDQNLVEGYGGFRNYLFIAMDGGKVGTTHEDNEDFKVIPFDKAINFVKYLLSREDLEWARNLNLARLGAIKRAKELAAKGKTEPKKIAAAAVTKTPWTTLPSGVQVVLVPGADVRNQISSEFIGGGHHLVYNFVPEGEIWIDDEIDPDDRTFILLHEVYEMNLMGQGFDYDTAHDAANRVEQRFRSIKTASDIPADTAAFEAYVFGLGALHEMTAKLAADGKVPRPHLVAMSDDEADRKDNSPCILVDLDHTIREWSTDSYAKPGTQSIMPNRKETLKPLRDLGFKVIGVTNHTIYPDSKHEGLTAEILKQLQHETLGLMDGLLDDICYTPEPHPDVLKPEPTMILHVMKRHGLDPEKCIMVGDNVDHDGGAAEKAGIPFITADKFFKDPDATVESVKKLTGETLRSESQEKKADAISTIPQSEYVLFNPQGQILAAPDQNRRYRFPNKGAGKPAPYEPSFRFIPPGGVPDPGVHGYDYTFNVGDGDDQAATGFEGGTWADPHAVLKDMYASMGMKANAPYRELDRARARVILRAMKRRQKVQQPPAVAPAEPQVAAKIAADCVTFLKEAAQRKKPPSTVGQVAAGGLAAGAGLGAMYAGRNMFNDQDLQSFNDYSTAADRWHEAKLDPRTATKEYAEYGARAAGSKPFGLQPVELMKNVRNTVTNTLSGLNKVVPLPFNSKFIEWQPDSGSHYTEFGKGPASAYLQRTNEWEHGGNNQFGQPFDYDTGHTIGDLARAVNKSDGNYVSIPTGLMQHTVQTNPAIREPERAEASRLVRDVRASGGKDWKMPENPQGFTDQIRNAAGDIAAQRGYDRDMNKLNPVQQTDVWKALESHLKQVNPELWRQKQVVDFGQGMSVVGAPNLYSQGLINPMLNLRKGLMYGGGALAAGGAVYILHQLLKKKKAYRDGLQQMTPQILGGKPAAA